MKQLHFIILLTCFAYNLVAQLPFCEPAPDGIPATDEPPGCLMCDISYFGTTASYTPDTTNYDFPCGNMENTQWISIRGNGDGFLHMEIHAFACENNQGLEFAVFDAEMNRISDCITLREDRFTDFNLDSFPAGSFVHVMIDGINGDLCEFELINHAPGDVFFEFIVSPDDEYVCPGKQVCYTVPDWVGGQFFDWGRPPNSFIVAGGETDQNFICVEFTEVGVGTVEVVGDSDCLFPVHGFLNVDVQLKISAIDTTLCPGDFLQLGSHRFDSTITTEVHFPIPGLDGCDSIVDLDLKVSDISPPQIFCTPDTFLRAMAIWWEKRIGAEEYQFFVNDQHVKTQSHTSYLLQPNFSDDSVKIRVQPLNTAGCNFEESEFTCAIPKISSQKAISKNSSLKILSNPTSGLVRIDSDLKIEGIQVFDFSGKEILVSNEQNIDLSGFESGIYILKIKTGFGAFTKKVAKF